MHDTETANTLENPLVYDLGGAIVDKQGNIYETFSFVIYDVYCLEKELMKSAYYAEKLPNYEKEIAEGERKLVNLSTAKKYIADLCEKYAVKGIVAHNASFDYRALTTTQRYVTKSKYRYFYPYGVPILDTLRMATDTIAKQPTYRRWCEENGYVRQNGTPRLTAEVLYRYISGDDNFEEEHTGLADVKIEAQIFAKCLAQHKKMRKSPWGK
jgi:DNA polymerase III epsilon subunit-like protein